MLLVLSLGGGGVSAWAVPPVEGVRAEMDGNWSMAVTIHERAVRGKSGREAAQLWNRISKIKRLRLGDLLGAIRAQQKAVAAEPSRAIYHFELASMLSEAKHMESALYHARKAVELDPEKIEYLRFHAQLANWIKRFAEAAKSYQQIYQHRPNHEEALNNAANSWLWAGKPEKAISLYEEYVKRHPERISVWMSLARAKERKGDVRGALSALAQARRIRPRDPSVNAELSRLLTMQNMPERALVFARVAVRQEPNNVRYLEAHARIANWAKRPGEAVVSLERLSRLKPHDEGIRILLAKSYEWAGEREKAARIYEAILAENPDDLALWLQVAESARERGDRQRALITLEKAYARFHSKRNSFRKNHGIIQTREIPILLYHCVGEQAENDYWVTTREFSRQMAELERKGYRTVTSRELLEFLYGEGQIPAKPVLITFDDACRNIYTDAWPILRRHGFVADIFLFTDAIADREENRIRNIQLWNGRETPVEYLIWPEIQELVAAGFGLGAHSKTHADMSQTDRQQIDYEILFSKLKILEKTGIDTKAFSYPFGKGVHREEVHESLRKADFLIAYAAHGGVENLARINPLEAKRVEIWGPNPPSDPNSRGVSVIPDPARPHDLFANRIEPDQAVRHYELSRLYSKSGYSEKAYRQIMEALKLDPKNIRYLRDMTQLAGWTGRYREAMDGFDRLAVLGEEDGTLILRRARVASYLGSLDESAKDYGRYLRRKPDDRKILMELIRVEIWRGNFPHANHLLNGYRARFGEDMEWAKAKADLLSWGNRPSEALDLVQKYLKEDPQDYKLNFARTLSLSRAGNTEEALASLIDLERRYPDSKDSELLRKMIIRDLVPSFDLKSAFITSSEDLQARSIEIQLRYPLSIHTRAGITVIDESFTAKRGGGLETIEGDRNANYRSVMGILRHRFKPFFESSLYIGKGILEKESKTIGGAALTLRPADAWRISFWYDNDYFHEYYSSSPRALSLGITFEEVRLSAVWEPDFRHHIGFQSAFGRLSDGNIRKSILFSFGRAVARRQYWSADLGFSAAMLDFDQNLDNGYYDPDHYRRFLFTGRIYRKIGERGGIEFSGGAGVARDESMEKFKPALEVSVTGTSDLGEMWHIAGGISIVHNLTRGGDSYTGGGLDVRITRRF